MLQIICNKLTTEMQVGIDVEFVRVIMSQKPLVRLLVKVSEYGDEGVSTRQLLKALKSHALHRQIEPARNKKYLRRVKHKRKGVGQPPIYNILTEKGQRLVDVYKHLE
jgi:hypothetical protein